MPRLRKIDRPEVEIKLPESIYRKLHDQLYSESRERRALRRNVGARNGTFFQLAQGPRVEV